MAVILGNFKWPPPTKEECDAVLDAINRNDARCVVRGCTHKRRDWELGRNWQEGMRLNGTAFCEEHLKKYIPV